MSPGLAPMALEVYLMQQWRKKVKNLQVQLEF